MNTIQAKNCPLFFLNFTYIFVVSVVVVVVGENRAIFFIGF